MIFFLMVLLPIAAALAVYPLCRKNEKLGNAWIITVTATVLAMALFLFFFPEDSIYVSGLCGVSFMKD